MAKETAACSAFAGEQGTIRSEMWNQIRRTEEDSMKMGTMEWALLRNHCIPAKRTVGMTT
ncbi:MAG: hypothetical protein A4E20_09625 [Nitrospira sp. SG-bin2]|nr:MAG: hypothetical protein A4E20_09625 [Nitrospira sp. SG-bin2]